MTLSHRSIAVQGLGFAPAHVALQGFVHFLVTPPWPGGGGGGMGGSSSTPRRYLHPARRRRRSEELLFILKP